MTEQKENQNRQEGSGKNREREETASRTRARDETASEQTYRKQGREERPGARRARRGNGADGKRRMRSGVTGRTAGAEGTGKTEEPEGAEKQTIRLSADEKSMRQQRLRQYRQLLQEIRSDRMRLQQLSRRLLAQDPMGRPRKEMRKRGDVSGQSAVYHARIEENLRRCCALAAEIQAYINRIADSEVRYIFKLRYIDGYSWQKVAFALGGYDESGPRKKHNRYLAEHK